MVHNLGQISGRRLKKEMIVIVHGAPSMNDGLISLTCRFKIFQELFPVSVAPENIFLLIAP